MPPYEGTLRYRPVHRLRRWHQLSLGAVFYNASERFETVMRDNNPSEFPRVRRNLCSVPRPGAGERMVCHPHTEQGNARLYEVRRTTILLDDPQLRTFITSFVCTYIRTRYCINSAAAKTPPINSCITAGEYNQPSLAAIIMSYGCWLGYGKT
jgi:hypothetical protein